MNRDISIEPSLSLSINSVFSEGQVSTDDSMTHPPSQPPKDTVHKASSSSKMLQELLDDSNKFYPTYEDKMPTSYLKSSRQVISYKENDLSRNMPREENDDVSTETTRTLKKSATSTKDKKQISAKTNHKTHKRAKEESGRKEKKKIPRKNAPQAVKDEKVAGEMPNKDTVQIGIAKKKVVSPTSFTKWEGKKVSLDYSFFDIPFLRGNAQYEGTPTSSMTLHCHSRPTSSNNFKKDVSNRIVPTVKLRSVLFDNYEEEYSVDFEMECDIYNPMSEIGKIIEHTAMVYLPKKYTTELKSEIITTLNKAFDTSDTELFINTVQTYNQFISKVPRNEIIDHLSSLSELPMSFVHDFLHIVYTRSIHPEASKLRRYKAFSNFVYGELLPGFLSDVYEECGLGKDSIFMDLGSGVGNCVIQAGLEFGCRLSVGCEIMPDASTLTEVQMEELRQRCKLMGIQVPKFEFRLRESFVDNPRINELISKCDVMLINNFLFDSDLNHEVEKILQHCKVGCKIISLKSLRSLGYTLDSNNLDNVLNKLHVEKHKFKENSVSWTHRAGEYYVSTVRDILDESLLSPTSRFRSKRRSFRYTR